MPFDAIFLSAVTKELQAACGARIDKIHQPERDTLVLLLRSPQGGRRLLMTASPNRARVQFTDLTTENPQQPPMFCMLLRKHLTGARIAAITQPPAERMLDFTLECTDEMGEAVTRHLILEIMGRNSNLILTGPDGRILDCMRRVDFEMSAQRQLLPGLFYHEPPRQDKQDPATVSVQTLQALTRQATGRADGWLLDHFAGLSPLLCRELVFRFTGETDSDCTSWNEAQRNAFAVHLSDAFSALQTERTPVMLLRDGKPFDFTCCQIHQYGTYLEQQTFPSFSALLDGFYANRDRVERIRQKTQTIHKTISNLAARTARKLVLQRQELEKTKDRDRQRELGDIVTANLHRITRGQTSLQAEDFYDPEGKVIEIPLSPQLSPQQNAARYYKEYTKARNAEKYLTEQIARGEAEQIYLESILDELSRAETERDVGEIRAELTDGGYLRAQGGRKKMKQQPSKPMVFHSSDGFDIYVGRNNRQNDQLTLRTAGRRDLWLHTQKIHGSHVIIACDGQEPPDQTITEAAMLAAYYSQAREGQNVPVDCTAVRNVKKPAGAKPGMVIYDHYRTVYVTPDPALCDRLR
jgi:predicted ribosome quality control (RQC) complex YloA/Tae2 family protein